MTHSPNVAESESKLIAECEVAMAEFTAQRDECIRKVRELMAAEDPAKGVFHATEIYRLQKDKLRLDVEIEFKRKKINRIRLGFDEADVAAPSGGLLF